MFIAKYLTNHKKYNFILDASKKNIPITSILKFIHEKNENGFCIIKERKKFKFFSGGDLRRALLQNKNFINCDNRSIKVKKFITVDYRKSMYDAYRILKKNDISFLPVKRNKNIISYLSLHEITESLSPERLNLENKKLSKFNLDIKKHLVRYKYANLFVQKNMKVLDAACGTGYGSYLFSKKAKSVLGVDYSKQAIIFAKHNYKRKNLKFLNSNILKISNSSTYDLIVSLETIEHLNKADSINWIIKCSKLLKKNGIFICSSPLLRIRNNKPFITNPHHLHEMRRSVFFKKIKKFFKPKIINAYIQNNDSLVPLTEQKEGLCIIALKK